MVRTPTAPGRPAKELVVRRAHDGGDFENLVSTSCSGWCHRRPSNRVPCAKKPFVMGDIHYANGVIGKLFYVKPAIFRCW